MEPIGCGQADRSGCRRAWPERQRNWRPERLRALAAASRCGTWAVRRHSGAEYCGEEPGAGALLPAIENLRVRRALAARIDAPRNRGNHECERQVGDHRRFANALDHDDRAALIDLALSGDIDEIEELSEASTRRMVGSLAIGHLERALASGDDIPDHGGVRRPGPRRSGAPDSVQQNRVDLAFDRHAWLGDSALPFASGISPRSTGCTPQCPTARNNV